MLVKENQNVTFSYKAKITRDLETNKTKTFNANKM